MVVSLQTALPHTSICQHAGHSVLQPLGRNTSYCSFLLAYKNLSASQKSKFMICLQVYMFCNIFKYTFGGLKSQSNDSLNTILSYLLYA